MLPAYRLSHSYVTVFRITAREQGSMYHVDSGSGALCGAAATRGRGPLSGTHDSVALFHRSASIVESILISFLPSEVGFDFLPSVRRRF